MPFPMIKLGYLAVKQISKPLANYIKRKAKTTPFLRNKLLLPPAQFYHKMDTTIKMKMLGLGKVSAVKPLNEDVAVDLAADMLGEAIIFSIATGLLLLEYKRQTWKDQNKEDVQNIRLLTLEKEIQNLNEKMSLQNEWLMELSKSLKVKPPSFNLPSQSSTQDTIPNKDKDTLMLLPKNIIDIKTHTKLRVENE